MGTFRESQIFKLVQKWYYLPNINEDVEKFQRCKTCQSFEEQTQNADLYIPLSVPIIPWEDVIMGLTKTSYRVDSVSVVDHFTKMAHFIV